MDGMEALNINTNPNRTVLTHLTKQWYKAPGLMYTIKAGFIVTNDGSHLSCSHVHRRRWIY